LKEGAVMQGNKVMQGNNKKEDLRILKTRKALYSALLFLLSRQKFTKLTVHDICTESMVSRTAFYAHFKDKYDLLEQWLAEQRLWLMQRLQDETEQSMEDILGEALQLYSAVIVNLLEDADREQQNLLFQFLSQAINGVGLENDAVMVDFLAGGVFHVVFLQMKEHRQATKEETKKTIAYVYRMILALLNWETGASRVNTRLEV
jgi:AcrR family transcriptional regulator